MEHMVLIYERYTYDKKKKMSQQSHFRMKSFDFAREGLDFLQAKFFLYYAN